MAVPPEKQEQQDEDDDFTFPTPPHFVAGGRGKDWHHRAFQHLPCSSPSSSPSPPVWLHLSSSSPIRRSFSAADSPWRDGRLPLSRCRSPALSDYTSGGGGFFDGEEEEEEERMDSLWEDLNDDDDLFLDDVSRRRSVTTNKEKEKENKVLGASRSSRRRAPGLLVMMRALKNMFVAHKGNRRVHRDEHSTIVSASASPSPCNKK